MEGAPFISAFFIGDLSSSGKYSTQGCQKVFKSTAGLSNNNNNSSLFQIKYSLQSLCLQLAKAIRGRPVQEKKEHSINRKIIENSIKIYANQVGGDFRRQPATFDNPGYHLV